MVSISFIVAGIKYYSMGYGKILYLINKGIIKGLCKSVNTCMIPYTLRSAEKFYLIPNSVNILYFKVSWVTIKIRIIIEKFIKYN